MILSGDRGYYSRRGFERASEYGLDDEYSANKGFMIKPLHKGALNDWIESLLINQNSKRQKNGFHLRLPLLFVEGNDAVSTSSPTERLIL